MELVNAICPNCGASLNVDENKDAAICQYCGSAYIVKKAIEKYNVNYINHTTNNINANVVNIVDNSDVEKTTTDKIYKVKPQITVDGIKRQLIVDLAHRNDIPAGLENITFGEVQESFERVIYYRARIESSYSVSIGYKETETYVVPENKPDGTQVLVTKTREKIAWRPMSSTYTDEDCSTITEDPNTFVSIYDLDGIPDEDFEKDADEPFAKLTSEEISHIRLSCDTSAYFGISHNLPGDKYQDLRTNTISNIREVEIYKVPCYIISYSLNNKAYSIKVVAVKNFKIKDKNDYDIMDEEPYVNNNGKKERTISIICWPFFFDLLIASIITTVYTPYGFILFFLATLPFLIAGNLLGKKSVKLYNTYVDEYNEIKHNEKLSIIDASLGKNGYSCLTDEEKSSIAISSYNKAERRSMGWIVALTVIGAIAFGVNAFSFILYWAV